MIVLFILHTFAQEPEEALFDSSVVSSSSSSTIPLRSVTVNLPEFGRVVGKRVSGVDFFGGLPYAAPPVGHLRWAPPEPAAPWAPAKLDATQFGPDCWQLVDPVLNPAVTLQQMSEDCLYLNVYTPAGASSRHQHYHSTQLLPVMVW
jgi:para-nitrobenzyl esterase